MELVPLFGAMFVTVAVLIGLVKIFAGWMKQRDKLLSGR